MIDVIRCKDCKYYKPDCQLRVGGAAIIFESVCTRKMRIEFGTYNTDRPEVYARKPEDFCSYAEKG